MISTTNLYTKNIQNFNKLDIYRILNLYNVTDPCLQHCIKKILCAGQRGSKNFTTDISEAIFALQRCLEMQQENQITDTPPINSAENNINNSKVSYA